MDVGNSKASSAVEIRDSKTTWLGDWVEVFSNMKLIY